MIANRKKTAAVLAIFFFSSLPSFAASRFALVIGNDKYKNAPLKNPIKDAKKVATALEKIGFSVTIETDLDKQHFYNVINKFSANLSKDDIAFVYYAGHGVAFDGIDYLLPTSPEITVAKNLQHHAINTQAMLNSIADTQAHTIMVLDACRNNPFSNRGITKRGLGFMHNYGSSYILYSAGYGEEALDDGTFARVLAAELTRPQSIDEMRVRLTRTMQKESGGAQTPNALTQLLTEKGTLFLLDASQPLLAASEVASAQPAPANAAEVQPLDENAPPPMWMLRLWRWADSYSIPEEEFPRNKNDLWALKELKIYRSNSKYDTYKYKSNNKINDLPHEIGHLKNLQAIYINYNFFDKLPAEIGQLKNLRILNVVENDMYYLPNEIGQLKSLQEMDASYNRLSNLPAGIGQAKSLKKLYLNYNSIRSLPEEIGQLSQLQELSLMGNDLRSLPENFTQLHNLTYLNIYNNPELKLTPKQEQFINKIKKVER